MDRTLSFLTSGLIALSLYFLLMFSFVYIYLDSMVVAKKFTPKEKTSITLMDIQIETLDEKGKEEDKKESEKDEGSLTPKKSEFDRNLLQKLDKYDKKEEDKKPPSVDDKLASRKKGEKSEAKKSAKELVQGLNLKKVTTPTLNLKSNIGESDPYYDKIYEILSRWNPGSRENILSAAVELRIQNSGLFTYRLSRKSGDPSFDSSIRAFLDNLNAFPAHKKNKTVMIEVIFKTKD